VHNASPRCGVGSGLYVCVWCVCLCVCVCVCARISSTAVHQQLPGLSVAGKER
jgi:hypothetical protein